MWLISVGILVLLFVALAIKYTPQSAIGWVVVLSWLFPAWVILPLFEGAKDSIVGTGVDVKTAVGSACLLLYCFMPGRTFPVRLVPCDYAMLSLVGIHFASDLSNDGFSWMILGRMYVEWYLPYICGRIALQSWTDATRLWWAVALAVLLMSCTAIVEAFGDMNVFEMIFGVRPEEGSFRDATRWGIQRAYGQAMHPIYFGVIQLALIGWVAYGTLRALKRRAFVLWVFALAPVVLGIVSTGSRGPLLGIVAALCSGVFFFYPRIRIPLGITFGFLFLGGLFFAEPIIEQLEQWSGESKKRVVIDGEKTTQSSVRSRLNVVLVNKIALKRSGLLGFGTQAVTGFPINVPVGPMEAEALKQVRFIDNTYILLTLRFGYAGALAFIAAAIISLGQFFYVGSRYPATSTQWFCYCVGSGLLAALLVLATVWMPYEIGFIIVWSFGLSSGILRSHRDGTLNPRKRISEGDSRE